MDTSAGRIEVFNPGSLAPEFSGILAELESSSVVRRIWEEDWTVWKPGNEEISSRLGWLACPETAGEEIPALEAFAAAARAEGLTRAVVLGMGGSSLAPDVFARLFTTAGGGLELEVLDSTEPGMVASAGTRLDAERTLFLVSSKSGTTAELVALLSYFYNRARRRLGPGRAGLRFAAITDPGTPLETVAAGLDFRGLIRGRPTIGGRFSALSAFGLLPAALKGIDLGRLLSPARAMADACRRTSPTDNPGAYLGAILGAGAIRGRDKLTFLVPPRLEPLAGWLEQLIAESTGKDGRGIVPVIDTQPGPVEAYGSDRLFIQLVEPEGTSAGPDVRPFLAAGQPLVRVDLSGPYDLGGHFFLWEFATAVAGHVLGINPFDQPDVESTKKKTREVLAEGQQALPPKARGLRIGGPGPEASPADALNRFLGRRRNGDYLAVLAFLPRRREVEEALAGLAGRLRLKTRLPVTVGFGPRYLHSTGQLHKGDGNRGHFLMLVSADLPEVEIPVLPGLTPPAADFASLFTAQARGDAMALEEKGRRVLTVEVARQEDSGVTALAALVE